MNKILLFLFLLGPGFTNAQDIPIDRIADWKNSGCADTFSFIRTTLFLEDFLDLNDPEALQDSLFQDALNFLGNQPVRLVFPEGTFYFGETINLKSNVHIQGSGANKTVLIFKPSNSTHGIEASGIGTDSIFKITHPVIKGSSELQLEYTFGLKEGDWLKLSFDDDELITSSWAKETVGQLFQIKSINGNSIWIDEALRLNVSINKNPKVEKILPVKNIFISDLSLEQENIGKANGANIYFNLVVNSKIKSIYSNQSNFSHVSLNGTSKVSITCSYFENAFNYGGGGNGYGIAIQSTSDDNLIENNIFNHLRHSILLQAGANGNVVAYNYSENPFWTEPFLPADAAGDLVLHGNYPFLNLFEGNVCQNIVIDDSHGINGPFNTFFRNRAMRYGLFMNDRPASNQQNFIANVILENGASTYAPLFNIKGNDHLIIENNFRGQIIPPGFGTIDEASFYLSEKPGYFFNHPFPCIKPREISQFLEIPAYQRFNSTSLTLTQCTGDSIFIAPTTGIKKIETEDYKIQPNPCNDFFKVVGLKSKLYQYEILDLEGKRILEGRLMGPESTINIGRQPAGIYWLKTIEKESGNLQFKKLIIKKP